MKAPGTKQEQFLTNARGKRTGVVLDLQTYEHLLEAEEELADLRAYDASRHRAHSEIAAGEYSTLTTYRSSRQRKLHRALSRCAWL
jgi:hypothetical protein